MIWFTTPVAADGVNDPGTVNDLTRWGDNREPGSECLFTGREFVNIEITPVPVLEEAV
jgi:hypothetical protein